MLDFFLSYDIKITLKSHFFGGNVMYARLLLKSIEMNKTSILDAIKFILYPS